MDGCTSLPKSGRGEKFGNYTIVREIARGGMAQISLAIDPRGHAIAVKRMLPALRNVDAFVGMFMQEREIASAIEHHNVCRVRETGAVDGVPYIAMEYLHGANLAEVLSRLIKNHAFLPVDIVVEIATQACDGLDAIHRARGSGDNAAPIVHRDVSPSNVFITVDGHVKLIDFGVARPEGDGCSELTTPGIIKGKLRFLSPERLLGKPADARSDVFSLGVVLHESLTRRALFTGANDLEICRAVVQGRVPPVDKFRADVPRELCEVVRRALSRDPADRFASAAELRYAISTSIARKCRTANARRRTGTLVRTLFRERLSGTEKLLNVAETTTDAELRLAEASQYDPPYGRQIGDSMETVEEAVFVSGACETDDIARAGAPDLSVDNADAVVVQTAAAWATGLGQHAAASFAPYKRAAPKQETTPIAPPRLTRPTSVRAAGTNPAPGAERLPELPGETEKSAPRSRPPSADSGALRRPRHETPFWTRSGPEQKRQATPPPPTVPLRRARSIPKPDFNIFIDTDGDLENPSHPDTDASQQHRASRQPILDSALRETAAETPPIADRSTLPPKENYRASKLRVLLVVLLAGCALLLGNPTQFTDRQSPQTHPAAQSPGTLEEAPTRPSLRPVAVSLTDPAESPPARAREASTALRGKRANSAGKATARTGNRARRQPARRKARTARAPDSRKRGRAGLISNAP